MRLNSLPWKPRTFVRLVKAVFSLKIKNYVLHWLLGEKWVFESVLVPLLGASGEQLVKEAEKGRVNLWDIFQGGYQYFLLHSDRRNRYFSHMMWERLLYLIAHRLNIKNFLTKTMGKVVEVLRSTAPMKACDRWKKYLWKIQAPVIYERSAVDVRTLQKLKERYFVLRENLYALSMHTRIRAARADVISQKLHMLVLPENHVYSTVKDKDTNEVIGGIVAGVIDNYVLENMRELVWELFKVKPAIRRVEDKKMCAAGPYINNRFRKSRQLDKDAVQFYITTDKLFKRFPYFSPAHQVLLERYVHSVLTEAMMALGVMYCPFAFEEFLKIHKPYLPRSDLEKGLGLSNQMRGPPTYTLFFTVNYYSQYHIDRDKAIWTILAVSNPLNYNVHFCLRTHNVLFRLEHGSVIYFRGRLLHGTEIVPSVLTLNASKSSAHNALIICCMAINGKT